MESIPVFNGASLHDNAALLEQIGECFRRDGIAIVTDFLPSSSLKTINREIDAHFAPLLAHAQELLDEQGPEKRRFECDVLAWNPCEEGNEAFLELQAMPTLEVATRACLGDGFTAPVSLVMLSTSGGRGQAWHQDCATPDGQFNLNRLLYTCDVTIEDGAIVVVPGSHHDGRIPRGGNQEPIDGELVLTPKAGTLVLLHGRVFHRVTPNLSGKERLSVNFRAFPRNVTPDVCRVGVYRSGAYDFVANQPVEG